MGAAERVPQEKVLASKIDNLCLFPGHPHGRERTGCGIALDLRSGGPKQ